MYMNLFIGATMRSSCKYFLMGSKCDGVWGWFGVWDERKVCRVSVMVYGMSVMVCGV